MMQKVNLRLVAFLLLLAFFQKMGLELWLHHWLHEPSSVHAGALQIRDKAVLEQQPIGCSCLDDTLMPLIGSAVYVYRGPSQHLSSFLAAPCSSALSNDKVLPALRGPPAVSTSL